MPLNFTAPLMPPWPLTPITGNKLYGSPNQAMHQGDRSLTHSPRSLKQPQIGLRGDFKGVKGGRWVKTGLEPKSQTTVNQKKKRV